MSVRRTDPQDQAARTGAVPEAAGDVPPPPMDFRTKEGQVADYLREGIITGAFPRGSRLKQAEIAERLHLSITPVREALKLLEAEGYVTGSSYRGASVVPFDASASAEVLQLRLLLESQLVRGASEKIKASDLVELRRLADEFEAAFETGGRAAARGINYRFHRHLYDIAGMPQTLHFVQNLWARYPFDLINAVQGRGKAAAREHDEVLRALSLGDASTAMFAMRKHIESGWSVLRA
jgi:DNA-binding GntR family transcriptional regulator